MNVLEIIKHVKDIGFDGFEPAVNEEDIEGDNKKWRELKERANSYGVKILTLATGLHWKYNLASNDTGIVEKGLKVIERMCNIANMIGAKTILVVPAVATPEVPYKKVYENAVNSIKKAGDIGENYGVKIGVENVWNKVLTSPLEFNKFIEDVNHKYVGAYFDVGNTSPQSYPEHWIEILKDKILAVHVKDFNLDFKDLRFTQLLQGSINWKNIMKKFKEIKYNGPITAEVSPYLSHPLKSAIDVKSALDIIFSYLEE